MIAAEILKLIEAVSPDDTAKLDEIDARVHNLIHPDEPVEQNSANGEWYNRRDGWTHQPFQYTRSRDALKAIRPSILQYFDIGLSRCNAYCRVHGQKNGRTFLTNSYLQRTEELAELHAIIQAIEYERSNK